MSAFHILLKINKVKMSQERVMLVSLRASPEETQVIRDELPPLEPEEIRLKVDKVGVSANNRFYAQAGGNRII